MCVFQEEVTLPEGWEWEVEGVDGIGKEIGTRTKIRQHWIYGLSLIIWVICYVFYLCHLL